MLPTLSPSEFVALANQTLDYAYPNVAIVGELANFKISNGKWIYADLKDDNAKLRCFGTVFMLPGPLEDGMMIEVIAQPRIHPQYGFSLNIQSLRPVGEGSIKKAANLLQVKLEREGLFSVERKRPIPYAPSKIGLIASEQSAAYADFIKILNARWQGVEVELFNVQVQGESAPETLLKAFQYFNQESSPVDVLVMIRGGGSADDLAAFSTEQVTRAVAGSRIPTVVAIGHEVDISLSELAADLRASTPSNAAELIFPDKKETSRYLDTQQKSLSESVNQYIEIRENSLLESKNQLGNQVQNILENKSLELQRATAILESIHPRSTLKRGYALIQHNGKLISSSSMIKSGQEIDITFAQGTAKADVKEVQ